MFINPMLVAIWVGLILEINLSTHYKKMRNFLKENKSIWIPLWTSVEWKAIQIQKENRIF